MADSDTEKLTALMIALEIPPSAAALSQHEIHAIGSAITRQAKQAAALSAALRDVWNYAFAANTDSPAEEYIKYFHKKHPGHRAIIEQVTGENKKRLDE